MSIERERQRAVDYLAEEWGRKQFFEWMGAPQFADANYDGQECDVCGKTFAGYFMLIEHMHGNGDPLAMLVCCSTTCARSALKRPWTHDDVRAEIRKRYGVEPRY